MFLSRAGVVLSEGRKAGRLLLKMRDVTQQTGQQEERQRQRAAAIRRLSVVSVGSSEEQQQHSSTVVEPQLSPVAVNVEEPVLSTVGIRYEEPHVSPSAAVKFRRSSSSSGAITDHEEGSATEKLLHEGEDRPPSCSSKLAAALEHAGGVRPASLALGGVQDAATITDVCSGGELPEVEIISLLEEQIPRYRLRADTLTQFTGYENEDWYIPTPALKPDEVDLNLSPEQIREVLNYFLLCSNRVSQMTKTYNDIEAVTRLLEEKEKDLELTARIGKELLTQNQKLEANIASLQAELKTANEKLTQLNHELLKKTELIQVLTNDVDDSGSEAGTPSGLRCINLDIMQRRIGCLEEENKQLRCEATQLAKDTTECEEAEQRLVQDIALQLANANMEVDGMAGELERHKEETRVQHEEIIGLSSKLSAAEEQLHRYTVENEELANMLHVTRDNQNKLATELADFKDRYAEVMGLLHDAQEQLRRQRRKGMPTARGGSLFPSLNATAQADSIACELETSLISELSLDSGISTDRIPGYKKVFETVRCASRNSASSTTTSSPVHQLYPRTGTAAPPGMLTSSVSSSGPRMSSFISPHVSAPPRVGPALSFPSLDSMGHTESESSMITDFEDNYPGGQRAGVPGVPGAADLEAALRRLTPAEVIARRAMLSSGSFMGYDYPDGGGHTPPSYLPYGCRTPDSIMSTGSSGLSGYSGHSGSWKLPEKLQIVKPLEGSLTLAAWSQLATPTLSGLLEERPGVKIRGGRPLEELGLEMYTLSDLEEDDEYEHPGKRFQDTGSIYTFTNSTVLHPDDNTTVTSSLRGSQMCTVAPSHQNTAPQTPAVRSRRNSTSTFSTTLGLAKLLNERGIKAITPSAVATPCGDRSFSPTATPCNSPDGSPPQSRSVSPAPGYSPLKLGFLSSGADLLRRTFTGETERSKSRASKRGKMTLSRSERKALTGIRLVEKLERIGLETIMSTTASSSISPLTLQGALYSRRTLKSPMTQLTSLKNTISSTGAPSPNLPPQAPPKSSSAPISTPREMLGVPGRPGSGALDQVTGGSRQRRPANGVVRPDLGMVSGNSVPPKNGPRTDLGAPPVLGTVSSLLFGRKGGLL